MIGRTSTAVSFSTLAVLTACTGRPWTHNDDLVRELLGFVLGDVLADSQIRAARAVAAPWILLQHPGLAQCHLPRRRTGDTSWSWSQLADDRRRRAVDRFGTELELRQIETPEWDRFSDLRPFLAVARRTVLPECCGSAAVEGLR